MPNCSRLCFIVVVLAVFGPALRAADVENLDVVVKGRVVDEAGAPIVDVTISAQAAALGQLLGRPYDGPREVRSDLNGRFEISLPFREVIYSLYVHRVGYDSPTIKLVPDVGGIVKPLNITLKRGLHTKVRGRVFGADGKPVGNLPLTLVGEYGFSVTTRTLVDGAYLFDNVPLYFGQGVLVAERGDWTIPLQIVRGEPEEGAKRVDVTLAAASRFEGVVRNKSDGKPIAGAQVAIRPWFASGFEMKARTNEEGQYVIDSVPAGEYLVEATADEYFDKPPRGLSYERERVAVAAGLAGKRDIVMRRSAVVRGRVLGPDGEAVANAAVSVPVTWEQNERRRYVRTNDRGVFEIMTGHIEEEDMHISATSARGGLAYQVLKPLAEGEVREGVTIKLPGMVRVRGKVVDEKGKAVAGAVCAAGAHEVSSSTGPEGAFDIGWLPLTADGKDKMDLYVRTPRPATVAWMTGLNQGQVDAAAEVYYEDVRLEMDTAAGKELDVSITLKPTDLLRIGGRVIDAKGGSVKEARVVLFAGNAGEDSWKDLVAPPLHGGRLILIKDKMLAEVGTDNEGHFRLRAVRFDGEKTADGTRYSIGVVVKNQAMKLVKDVTLPVNAKERVVVIQLD